MDEIVRLVLTIDKLQTEAKVKGCGTAKRTAAELWKILIEKCENYEKSVFIQHRHQRPTDL